MQWKQTDRDLLLVEEASYLKVALGHRSSEITCFTAHSSSFLRKQFKDHVLTINSISGPTAFLSTVV